MESLSQPGLRLRLFGPMQVELNGAVLSRTLAKKDLWLVALLALNAGQAISRERLSGLLWPDTDEEQALYYLRRSLSHLRTALGDQADRIEAVKPRSVRLNIAAEDLDVATFDRLIRQGDPDSLTAALSLYRAPLLEDCLEEWAIAERLPRQLAYETALGRLADRACNGEDWPETVRLCRMQIAADPLQEAPYRMLMRALAASGAHAAALQIYRDLRLRLREEINADPDPETQALHEIVRQSARQEPRSAPAPRPAAQAEGREAAPVRTSSTTLPHPLTRLIGRDLDRDAILIALRTSRLVTLAATGGVGKTRLAIEVAHRCADRFRDGVQFLELAAVTEPAYLVRQVAQWMGLRENPQVDPIETLTSALQDQERLLVLDNCEHLLDASASLAETLLRRCPKLCVLATSRQPLGVPGEAVWRVASLAAPAEGDPLDESKLDRSAVLDYPAVQLFLDRVSQTYSEFRLSPADLPHLATICRRLDGIPLALELAAYRVRALSLEKIAERLDNRFHLLTGGNRTALPRQQTLRALIDWSYHLLEPAERTLFARLAIFADGWTLGMAEQVCAGEGIEEWEVMDLLISLTDRSLVLYDPGQERYRFLETIREYAFERLQEFGETDRLTRCHLEAVLQLVEQAEPQLIGPSQVEWLERLERERQNLRAALSHVGNQSGLSEIGLRIAGRAWRFWLMSGSWKEGVGHLKAALTAVEPDRALADRANALNGLGNLAFRIGDLAEARAALDESLRIRTAIGDREGVAAALHGLATLLTAIGEYAEVRSLFEQSLEINREFNRLTRQAQNHIGLGNLASRTGNLEAARASFEEAVRLARLSGDPGTELVAVGNLGIWALSNSDPVTAEAYARQALGLCRTLNNLEGEALYLPVLGGAALERGDYAGAVGFYLQAAQAAQRLGDRRVLTATTAAVAWVRALEGNYPESVRLYACALTHYDRIGVSRTRGEQEANESHLNLAREALGGATFERLWQEGAQQDLLEALKLGRFSADN